MSPNPALTIMQMEQALNNLQNTMVDENGKLTLDENFLRLFDELMEKLKEARDIAEGMRKSDKR